MDQTAAYIRSLKAQQASQVEKNFKSTKPRRKQATQTNNNNNNNNNKKK